MRGDWRELRKNLRTCCQVTAVGKAGTGNEFRKKANFEAGPRFADLFHCRYVGGYVVERLARYDGALLTL
jgi:hypothetical protein